MLLKKKLVLPTLAFLVNIYAKAQSAATTAVPEKTDMMRSDGKIYVVMAVVTTILVGLMLYVLRLDRKIAKLEKGDTA